MKAMRKGVAGRVISKQVFWREVQLTCSRIQLWREREKSFWKEKTLTLAAFK